MSGGSANTSATSSLIHPRGIPKLGGSSAGFIILIVILCLIILVSLAATFYILRKDNSSDEEKQNNYRRAGPYVTPLDDDEFLSKRSWFHRTYQRLPFTRSTSNGHIPQIVVREAHGLPHNTSRDDAWDSGLDDEPKLKPPSYPTKRLPTSDQFEPTTTIPSSTHRLSTPNSVSTGSVRFNLNNNKDIPYLDRERYAPSPSSTLPNIHTQLSSPASSPTNSPSHAPRRSRVISLDGTMSSISLPGPVHYEKDITQHFNFESSSAPSLVTFEGGTKFIESL